MKTDTAMILVLVLGGTFLVALWLLGGCALHNPVPVDPNYPPEPPFTQTVTKDASAHDAR